MPGNVVHIINSLHALGGAEHLVGTIARLAPAGPLRVMTLWKAPLSVACDLPPGVIEVASLFPLSPTSLRAVRAMLRSADLVHVHLSPAQFLAALVRTPKLFTQHNSWNRRRVIPFMRLFDRLLYARYQMVVGVSDAVTEDVRRWVGGAPDRFHTVPNGIDLAAFDAPARSWSERLRYGVVRIGMAARFTANKDHETLLCALALLPRRFELHLAGDGRRRPIIQRLAERLGLGERVRFLGAVEHMRDFYASIDIYVQSSHHDGFSLVAVEAMASGVPLITTDTPGLRDTVGASGQCVPLRDARALAGAIMATVSDAEAYEAMARRGKRQALKFDGHRMIAAYEALYLRLASARADVAPASALGELQ